MRLQALQHRRLVQRPQRAQVDDLRIDAFAHQLLRGFERNTDADRIADQGHVLARADDARLADRQDVIVQLRHVEMLAVEQLVLEEDDRVVAADRRLQQALGVGRAVRRDDDEARNAGIPGPVVLAVLSADTRCGSVRTRNTIGQRIWPPDM